LAPNSHEKQESMEKQDRFQLHLVLPSNQQAGEHPEIRRQLERGFLIAEIQRVSDREVLVTFVPKAD
jgi:hypothetical protein